MFGRKTLLLLLVRAPSGGDCVRHSYGGIMVLAVDKVTDGQMDG